MSLNFTTCTQDDRASILSLEVASFPADEAADDASLQLRLEEAGEYFYKLTRDGQLIGFINGTCIQGPNLEHDSMTSHVKMGPILVIHSVTVKECERRKYYALYMLHRYISYMKRRNELEEIRLLTKPLNMNLYLLAGFKIVGISPIVHGADAWFEMKLYTGTAYQLMVDSFASTAFRGNPAAVVFEWGECSDDEEWKLKVAAENNQSETAFVRPLQEEGEVYALTWFTPLKEVELCGHATLAAASGLYHSRRVQMGQKISFKTPSSGILYAQQQENGIINLDFPETPVTEEKLMSEKEKSYVCQAFGIQQSDIIFLGRSIYDLVVEIKPEA